MPSVETVDFGRGSPIKMRIVSALILVAVGLAACSSRPVVSDAEYSKTAMARLIGKMGTSSSFRLISMSANARLKRACGWIDLGPRRGIALFEVDGQAGVPGAYISVSAATGATVRGRIEDVYYSQLSRMNCELARVLPPTPNGFAVSQATTAEVARLWDDTPTRWAIFQPPGEADYVGIRRRTGGGVIITPPFHDREQVENWIQTEGDVLSEAELARGKAAMEKYDAYVAATPDLDQADKCPGDGMDRTVELRATARAPS